MFENFFLSVNGWERTQVAEQWLLLKLFCHSISMKEPWLGRANILCFWKLFFVSQWLRKSQGWSLWAGLPAISISTWIRWILRCIKACIKINNWIYGFSEWTLSVMVKHIYCLSKQKLNSNFNISFWKLTKCAPFDQAILNALEFFDSDIQSMRWSW